MLKHNQVYMSQTLNPVKLKLDPGLSKPSFKSATCKLIYKREKKKPVFLSDCLGSLLHTQGP